MQFPEEVLSLRLSADGIQFVKSLLVRLPRDRLEAETALRAPWLQPEHEPVQLPSGYMTVDSQQPTANLHQARLVRALMANNTQDASSPGLSVNLGPCTPNRNLTIRPRKKELPDTPRVQATKLRSESSDSRRSHDTAEAFAVGKEMEIQWSEEEETNSGEELKFPTDEPRDNEGLAATPSRALSGTEIPSPTTSIQAERRENTQLLRKSVFALNAAKYFPKVGWFWAARHDYLAVIQSQLGKGVNVDRKDEDGRTALYWAAYFGHEAVTHLLLERGADIDGKDMNGLTALHRAAWNGHGAVTHLLLGKGADIDGKDRMGLTALHLAARSGHEAVTRLLLEKGADIDGKGMNGLTALHLAASCGYEAVTHLLLERGADIDGKDMVGRTALYQAALYDHGAVTHLLLERGADIDGKTENGWTALHRAAWNGHGAVTHLLLGKGADIDGKDMRGLTALHLAARNGHGAVVQLLLYKGADIQMKDLDGKTAEDLAALSGHRSSAKLLKDRRQGKVSR